MKIIVTSGYPGDMESCMVQRVKTKDGISSTIPGHPWLMCVTTHYLSHLSHLSHTHPPHLTDVTLGERGDALARKKSDRKRKDCKESHR